MRRAAAFLLVLAMLAVAGRAAADEERSALEAELTFELQYDWSFHSEDPDEERHDTFATVEAEISVGVAPGVQLKSLFVFEEVRDPGPGEDRFFGDMGLFVEELYGEYSNEEFAVRLGKFGQKFGIAWDVAPGIWGGDFADYELAEQMGVAAELRFGAKEFGRHSFTLGTFFADTTFLSDSAFTSRGRLRKSDGGPGNTEDFSSFSISLEGREIPDLPGLGYHLAYMRRGSDAPGEADETGLAAGFTHKFAWRGIEIRPIAEIARLEDAGGAPGTEIDFLTLAAETVSGPWFFVLAWTGRRTRASGAADEHDHFTELSLGYALENGPKVSAGWRHIDDAGIASDTLGVLFEFDLKI